MARREAALQGSLPAVYSVSDLCLYAWIRLSIGGVP